jgi:putative ABC transport system substrate-binding protein
MRRREFITLLAGAAAWPVAVRAQQPTKLPTIGYLGAGSPATQSQWAAAFVQRLRQRGWIEGRDVAIEYRWAEGQLDRLPALAAALVSRQVAAIAAETRTTLIAEAASLK